MAMKNSRAENTQPVANAKIAKFWTTEKEKGAKLSA
jgi:hypothetical protein